jgi:hypothetical protein
MVESAMAGRVSKAAMVFAPGHLGELTQIVDTALVDAVVEETATVQRRVRLLPTRVVVYFVLGLALFEDCGYRLVWDKLTASLQVPSGGLGGLGGLVRPSVSALCRARRRVGAAPLRALFEVVAGALAWPSVSQAFWCGLRTVAFDGTLLRVPDAAAVKTRYRKRGGAKVSWPYPLLRLTVLVECGTRALIAAAFGPDSVGESGYARRLLDRLGPGMLLLADSHYDDGGFLQAIGATGAQWLVRSGAGRRPLIEALLADGSYLTRLPTGKGLLQVRVIEAQLTIGYADGTVETRQWRLLTSLLDPHRYPAAAVIALYHERWEVESSFYAIKDTLLCHGRVLRSQHPDDLEQEMWAILAVYQAVKRLGHDAASTRPALDPDRISFTVALHTARNQVILATAIDCPTGDPRLGPVGRAVLADLLPPRRQRIKARTKKIATSKYKGAGTAFPARSLGYTLHTHITIFEQGLTARSKP